MTQEKCYSCGGKGTYSQMHGIYGAEDFYKRDGFTEKPSIHTYPCNSCEGTGMKNIGKSEFLVKGNPLSTLNPIIEF